MGPVAAVVVRQTIPERIDLTIAQTVTMIGDSFGDPVNHQQFEFLIKDTTAIGGGYRGAEAARPFMINKGRHEMGLDDAFSAIRTEFGFEPFYSISIGANCNDTIDHRLLAELSAYLADELGGVVDLQGDLTRQFHHQGHTLSPLELTKHEQAFAILLRSMPGRIVGVAQLGGGSQTYIRHFADADFLRAWMRQPMFRMVK